MKQLPAQFRFLGIVLGLWTAGRAVVLLSPEQDGTEPEGRSAPPLIVQRLEVDRLLASDPSQASAQKKVQPPSAMRAAFLPPPQVQTSPAASIPLIALATLPSTIANDVLLHSPRSTSLRPSSSQSGVPRWSGEAWALWREGSPSPTLPALGGAQIGGRLRYRLGERVHVSARLYAPLGQVEAGDAAVGIEWQPVARLPLHILVERREGWSAAGRSAFSALAHGGMTHSAGKGRIDLYGQAGIVGFNARDLFADGAAAISWPVAQDGEKVRLGAGLWAAVQPGAARVDIGPRLSLRPLTGTSITLSLDWRQRVAGNAEPASGPALTVAAGF